MNKRLVLGDIEVDVVLKDIRNVHLSVNPPDGAVRVSAPTGTSLEAIRLFVIAKLGWIKARRGKLKEQERERDLEYLERESHYLWGQRFLLEVVERDAAPSVAISAKRMALIIRPGTQVDRRAEILEAWYRLQLREALDALLKAWETRMGVKVEKVFVQHMKTRWGSCNSARRHIRINTELAKKPRECLEYIVVHELAHFIEPNHDARFVGLMDLLLPQWRGSRSLLNSLPIKHEEWGY